MDTAKRSPKLHGIIERNFCDEDAHLLHQAFGIAMRHGGDAEWDFSREEGVSYNPRPARAFIIAYSDAKISDCNSLAALILASVGSEEISKQPLEGLPEEVLKISKGVIDCFERLAKAENDNVRVLSACLCLDRARQFHRAKESIINERHSTVLTQVETAIDQAPLGCPIAYKLKHWLEIHHRGNINTKTVNE